MFFPFIGISQNTQAGTDIMETIITSGSNATGSSGSVTYSIGQVFYTYMGESVFTVAQGVQQQESDKDLGTPEVENPKTQIFVYPNPTTDFVNINTEGFELDNRQQSYRLYDIQGRLLQQNKIDQTQTQVSLNNLSSSLYLLVIYVDNKLLQTFKILKK